MKTLVQRSILCAVLALSAMMGHAQPGWAQTKVTPVATLISTASTGDSAELNVEFYNSVSFTVTMSSTGTVAFKVSGNGTTYRNLICLPSDDTTGTPTASATTSGIYQCNVAAMQKVKVNVSANAGTITVESQASTAVAMSGGGGSGGGGTVDTELPAAVTAPSGGAAPTAPSVWAYIVCKALGASTYDPCTGGDNTAHDAADAGNPLKIGAKASSATSSRTSVSNNDRTDVYAGIDGILIVRPYANLEDRVSGILANTDGASTAVVAAQGAGIRFCATTVIVSNSSATNVTVDLRDGTGGSVIATIPAAANMGGAVVQLPVPLCTTANTALAMDGSAAATTVTVTAIGFKTAL